MSTDYQKTTAKAIPSTRRVTINDSAHMPLDYSTTPGGTLFSTTPGGTNCSYTFMKASVFLPTAVQPAPLSVKCLDTFGRTP